MKTNFLKGLTASLILALIATIGFQSCSKKQIEIAQEDVQEDRINLPKQVKGGGTFTRAYVFQYNDCPYSGSKCTEDVVVTGIYLIEEELSSPNGVQNFFSDPSYSDKLGFSVSSNELEELTTGNYNFFINTSNGNRVWLFSESNRVAHGDDVYCAIKVQ